MPLQLQHSEIIYFMDDLDTNVTKWSASAVDYFGLPGQYIYDTQKVWEKLIHPDDRAIFEQDITEVFAGRKSIMM